ncbi:hypothetical protein BV20DRAFT_336926 [Pilatotrama ljubarskyi]|nr:hypothetical protein BV20DRAFT_336926 [Pilatotrama ljubarskyi]
MLYSQFPGFARYDGPSPVHDAADGSVPNISQSCKFMFNLLTKDGSSICQLRPRSVVFLGPGCICVRVAVDNLAYSLLTLWSHDGQPLTNGRIWRIGIPDSSFEASPNGSADHQRNGALSSCPTSPRTIAPSSTSGRIVEQANFNTRCSSTSLDPSKHRTR